MAQQTLRDGSALRKFREMVSAQGGDPAVTEDYSIFPQASIITELPSPRSGFLSHMETQTCGLAAMVLGAGRATKEDSIDHAAGIVLSVKPGDRVEQGQTLATLYCNSPVAVPQAEQLLLGAFQITDRTADTQPLLYRRVEAK